MVSFDRVLLRTARLTLRPLREGDAVTLFRIFSDPEATRYWSAPPWSNTSDADAYIARDLKAMSEGTYLRLGVERQSDGELIGNCTLFNLVLQSRRAEVGYILDRTAWGRGYMLEAVTALLDFGFTELDLNRVEADIDPRNTASEKLLLRLGFSEEGYLPERWIVGNEVSDTRLFGLLKRHWNPHAVASR